MSQLFPPSGSPIIGAFGTRGADTKFQREPHLCGRLIHMWCEKLAIFNGYCRLLQVLYGGRKSAVVIIPCSVPQGSVLRPLLVIMRPSSLGGAAYCVALCLSVCLSVCPSVPLSSVTSRHLANYNDTHVLFGRRRGPHIVRPSRPLKLVLYMVDLADVVSAHDVKHHAYSDDTQLYLQCRAQEATTAAHRLEVCIKDVQCWMEANRLKLNADNTDLLSAGSRYAPAVLGSSGPSLDVGTGPITASDHVRLLGVTVSSDLSLETHVSGICSTCCYWLRQIRRIRRSLDTESTRTLVYAFVASGVDYCNTVLAGSPRFVTDRLQRVLNAAARVITGTRNFARGLSDLLQSQLHWLDI